MHRFASLAIVSLLAACTGLREFTPGAWRSPQPGEDALARRIDRLQLRTVVCLRGNGDGAAATRRATENSGAVFHSIPMSATRPPKPETLLALWHVAATAERPLLLHCLAGADRTGLASALVVLHDTGDLDRARGELTILHGHVAWTATCAMDDVLDAYEPHAAEMKFPDWVQQVYAPAWNEQSAQR